MWCPVGGLAGGFGAGCISQDTYLLYGICDKSGNAQFGKTHFFRHPVRGAKRTKLHKVCKILHNESILITKLHSIVKQLAHAPIFLDNDFLHG